jgi:hypothetical protein
MQRRRRRRGGALTQHPGDTTVAWRGSAHVATTASSQGKSPTIRRRSTQLTKPRSRRGQGQQLKSKLEVAMAKVLSFGGEGDASDQEAIE